MGLTGRTQKRLKRYRDQYLNIFRQINTQFGLQLREDEFWGAANELAWVKVKNKKWNAKFWRNPFNWLQNKSAKLTTFGNFSLFPQYSKNAWKLENEILGLFESYKVNAADYLDQFEKLYHFNASLTEVSKPFQTDKIHAGAQNYAPTGSGLDALLNSRGGKAAAGGHKFRHKAYPINPKQSLEKQACQSRLNIHFERVCEGFKRLNEVGYGAGLTFLADFKNSVKRNSYNEIYRIEQLTTQENIHNYRRDLRCKIVYPYRQEFFSQLDKNNDFDSGIDTEDFTNNKISSVLADPNLTPETKKEHFYYYCLSFLQAFFGELLDEEDKTIRLMAYEVAAIDQDASDTYTKAIKQYLDGAGLAWVRKEEELDNASVSAALWAVRDYIEVDDLPRERVVALAKEVAQIADGFAFVRTISNKAPSSEPDIFIKRVDGDGIYYYTFKLNQSYTYSALFEFDGRKVGAVFTAECEFSWEKWELSEILKFDF